MQADSASTEWLMQRDCLLVLEKLLRRQLELCEQGGPQPTALILEVDLLRSKVNHLFQDVLREARNKAAPD